jgi:hypothetical protein
LFSPLVVEQDKIPHFERVLRRRRARILAWEYGPLFRGAGRPFKRGFCSSLGCDAIEFQLTSTLIHNLLFTACLALLRAVEP